MFGQVAGKARGAAMGPGGMTPGGTFRVTRDGQIIRVAAKRRKKGYRMPRMVAEQIRANNDMMRNISTAVLMASVSK